MTEVAAVDIDGLLAEIFLTPEGRANPYPRDAAIREHARGFRSNLGFVVVARYDDCRWVLRDPRFGKGEPGPVWEGYCLTHEQWRERFVDLELRMTSMLGLDPRLPSLCGADTCRLHAFLQSPVRVEPLMRRVRRADVDVGGPGESMLRRGRKFGLVLVVALALVPTAAILPAGAATVPAAPAAPSASPGNGTARVTWVAPNNGGSPINQYIVTPFVGATAQAPRTFNSTAVTQVITGLTIGTTYTFRVKAHNAVGTGASSAPSNPAKVGAPATPAKPQVAPGNAVVRLNWVAPTANGAPVTGYIVTPFKAGVVQPVRTFNSTALAQPITGLTNGVNYTFKVQAKNARGNSPVSPPSLVAKPTAQPTLKTAMNATIGQPILVNSYGMTVYMFDPDADATPTISNVNGGLRTAWPYVTWAGALTVAAPLTVGMAAANIQPDNTRLVAYNGHLLYTFFQDHVPGDVTGQAVNQFFVLDANGNKIP